MKSVFIILKTEIIGEEEVNTSIEHVFTNMTRCKAFFKDLQEGDIENYAECFSDPDDIVIQKTKDSIDFTYAEDYTLRFKIFKKDIE